ncbi:hypothetical protein Taro_025694 [Colocasia esculenta]|uniref:Pectinesterase n=1 Tax=Colocasia esculenta TaxID=4460 RepID=A0A843VEY3_COLES|nr:hypothetical protein [Colocasia esculenta]
MQYQGVSSMPERKNLLVWACTVALVVLLGSTISFTAMKLGGDKPSASLSRNAHRAVSRLLTSTTPEPAITTSSMIATACKSTLYPGACESALASAAGTPAKTQKQLFDVSVEFAMSRAHSARSLAYNLTFPQNHRSGPYPPTGTYDCVELLDTTLSLLTDVLDDRKNSGQDDVETWLSAALTNQVTCLESLESKPPAADEASMDDQAKSLSQFISNSLALHKSVKRRSTRSGWMNVVGGRGGGRKLLSENSFPTWVSAGDRRLLSTPGKDIVADAVVATDGSGTHKTIKEALAFVSLASGGGRSVIYVKAGTYKENIKIAKGQTNVMLVGDGKDKSVIIGSRNAEDGWTTYQSATVAAQGAGFIAKDITIINSSGPSKHQAVALRVGGDRAVVYRCSIQGYQDTLYTHSNRQFYRECDIYGTVDFIFGNSAVVLQSCNISPRKPNPGQKNSVTAQGRIDPNQNTGISIHNCRIAATGDLAAAKHSVPTYLGRPWQKYSRVVVMQSYLDDAIHPAGWEQWSGSFALSTLYYGEYGNTGPGASTSGRVQWPGVHPSMSVSEASKFTVSQFIYGNAWLPGTDVPYTGGL